ncbi:ribosyl nicotinamide transporter, PnuC-like [Psychrobacter sp. JCM 18901]|nr:ribosyl nicotinamide transporter, PnuC-like [Psychrobacter sp. JCM 18901]
MPYPQVFWLTTDHTTLDWFYLAVSFIGLVCVVSLSFRKNVMGNGFGMGATAGEVIVQATSGAVGLMLAPLFNFFYPCLRYFLLVKAHRP